MNTLSNKSPVDIVKKLKEALSNRNNTKALRFLLNCLSGTPVAGGGFSATAGLWAEREQDKINEMITNFAILTDDRISQIEKSLVDRNNQNHYVAGYIKFNPNKVEIIDASGISSLTDNGALDFTINFTVPFHNYIFNCYGSNKVTLTKVSENEDGLKILFQKPCPDKVTVVFFEPQYSKVLRDYHSTTET